MEPFRKKSGYILISYDESDEQCVRKIWIHLLERGFAVRADIDISQELILDSLSDSVKNASVVVAYLSKGYMANNVCKTVCRYSRLYNKQIVALSLYTDLTFHEWVTELQRSYRSMTLIDISRLGTLLNVVEELVKILQNHDDLTRFTESLPLDTFPTSIRAKTNRQLPDDGFPDEDGTSSTTRNPIKNRKQRIAYSTPTAEAIVVTATSLRSSSVQAGTAVENPSKGFQLATKSPTQDQVAASDTHRENVSSQTGEMTRFTNEIGEVLCFVRTSPNHHVTKVSKLTSVMKIELDDDQELISEVLKLDPDDNVCKDSTITFGIPLHAGYQPMASKHLVGKLSMDSGRTWKTIKSSIKTYQGITVCELQGNPFGIYGIISGLVKDSHTIGRNGGTIKLTTDPQVCLSFKQNDLRTPEKVQIMVRPVEKAAKNLNQYSVISCSPFLVVEFETNRATDVPVKITLPVRQISNDNTTVEPHCNKSHRPSTAPSRHNFQTKLEPPSFHVLSKLRTGTWKQDKVVDVERPFNDTVSFSTKGLHKSNKMVVFESTSTDRLSEVADILENACNKQTVNIILNHHKDNDENFITRIVSSENCKNTLVELREENYCGPPSPSKDVLLKEGQLMKITTEGNIRIMGRDKITYRFYKNLRVKEEFLVEVVDPLKDIQRRCYMGKCIFSVEHSDKSGNCSIKRKERSTDNTWEELVVFDICLKKYETHLTREVHLDETPHDLLSESVIQELTDKLGVEWTRLGIHLGLSNAQIQRLKLDYSHTRERSFQMLILWLHSTSGKLSKIRQLSHALIKEGRCDLSQWLQMKLG
ncbi:death domain-containing protein 1-like [Anneissia japonica]|uniref:death domain-containing protein 1-like n=1 Tax=Anneissia japonica TaxID=1529436 RepID=UPI0014254C2D|nr:death domain-containing protein 1-like [Anneissia japonica]